MAFAGDTWEPVAAAALGGIITGTFLLLGEAFRWRRARNVRWEDVKRKLYADLISALAETHRRSLLAVHPGNPQPDTDWQQARVAWQTAERAVAETCLLAPEPVQVAATALLKAHKKVTDTLNLERGPEVARATYARLTQFDDAARGEAAARAIYDIPASAEAAFLMAARKDINPT